MSYPARAPASFAGIDGTANAAGRRHMSVRRAESQPEAAAA
jgi:hypothetical protein